MEAKVADSDLVITGVVSQTLACGAVEVGECSVTSVTAKIVVHDVLKGVAPKEILFRCRESIAEFSPRACEIGKKYLLFLQKDGNGIFHSANGPYGAYDLSQRDGE
ncbi:MAG: hypothetical protein ACREPC_01005 [Stenotrophomonas sp.]